MAGARIYPHVSEIQDWRAQQSMRLAWDRIHDLTEQLQAAQASLAAVTAGQSTTAAQLTQTATDVQAVLALTQQPGAAAGSAGGSGGAGTGTSGGTSGGGGDGGDGQTGCASAGATGHDTGGLLNAVRAGQIVCGTAHEYPALLNATATQAARDVNAEELVLRMIWHLRNAGFTAGRQQNPSGAISKDKLCVVVDGITRAYDVFTGKNNFAAAMSSQMNVVTPANLIDDAGTPD